MSFCTKCGTEVPIDASFCTKCGNKLQGEQSPTPTPTTPKVEVSSQSDETKPTIYNPIATALWGLVTPIFSAIIFYLNYKSLKTLPTSKIEKPDIFEGVESQDSLQGKWIGRMPMLCIIFGILIVSMEYVAPFFNSSNKDIIFIALASIFFRFGSFALAFQLRKDIKFIYGSEEYNKKPLLIPVIIMIVAAIAFVAITPDSTQETILFPEE